MKSKAKGTVMLISSNIPEVKVCDIVNGRPKVKRIDKGNIIEFHLRYSMFHKEIKKYDRATFEKIE